MFAAIVLVGALVLVGFVASDAGWGVLAMATALPATQSHDTGIPGVNPFNILLFSLIVGLFFRTRTRDDYSGDRFPAWISASLFCVAVFYGFVNGAFLQYIPAVSDTRAYSRFEAFLMLKETWCLVLLMFLMFWAGRTTEEVRRYLHLTVLGMGAEVAFCILEFVRKLGGRITGHVRQPNSLGALMSLMALTAGALYISTTDRKKRWLYLAICLGASFACIQSRSRGGLLALGIGLLIVTLLRNRIVFVLLVVMAVSYRVWLPDAVLQRVDQAYKVNDEGDVQAADTAAQRITIWKAGLRMIKDRPMGVGLGAFSHFSAMYGTVEDMKHPDKSPHNEFVRLAAELSPVGLLIFVAMLARLTLAAWRCIRLGKESGLNQVGYAGLGALLGISLPSMAGTFFFQATIAGHFWMVMGLLGRAECLARPGRKAPA
jgi:O-antigen ligase